MLWLVVIVSVMVIAAILRWAPRYKQCASCGTRVRVEIARCNCGRDLAAPVRSPEPTWTHAANEAATRTFELTRHLETNVFLLPGRHDRCTCRSHRLSAPRPEPQDTVTAYEGELFFSEEREAINAAREIRASSATRHLLVGHPPGVILLYCDPSTGRYRRYVDTATRPTPCRLSL